MTHIQPIILVPPFLLLATLFSTTHRYPWVLPSIGSVGYEIEINPPILNFIINHIE